MEGTEVILQEMLACREERQRMQDELLTKYGRPLISFSMNIPGPVKTNEDIRAGFEAGRTALLEALAGAGIRPLCLREKHAPTGDELLLVPDGTDEGPLLKELTTGIEETHPLGRLFDMDVLTVDGRKLSRPVFRKCLICGMQAQDCARARRHSVPEMQAAVEALLLLGKNRNQL